MAIRRHIIAARNTTPESMGAALAPLKASEIEEANGWCWAMASVWTTGSDDLLRALEDFGGPYFLVTTEDACRWRFHLRGKAQPPFDTIHEFQWIRSGTPSEAEDDWKDLDEDEPAVEIVEFPGFPPLPVERLEPLDFEDDFFEPYTDEDDEDEDEEYREPTPREYIVECYEDNGVPLPTELVEALSEVPDSDLYAHFLALHGSYIADALERFGINCDRGELARILTGESVTAAEMDSDVGNTWRFLHHLGLGPKFAEALQEYERAAEPEPESAEDPGERIVRAAGKLALHAVEGGPAPVPLKEAFLFARVTYYQDTYPEYVVRVRFDSPANWPTGRIPSYAATTPARKGFGADLSLQGMDTAIFPRARQRLGDLFAQLPDGARLELLAKGQFVKTRLSGTVQEGEWLIESASSPLTGDNVAWMLEVFRAAESRGPQTARDEAELEAILDAAARHIVLCNDPPRRDGLRLQCDSRRDAEVLGALFFRRRLAHTWDFAKIERHVATKFKDWRKFEEQLARENALPATDVVVYEGESSRFFEADYKARSMDKSMREKAKGYRQTDKEMASLGYVCLGAVVCERVGGGIIRCYANAAERTFSASYVLPFGQGWHDFSTRFDDGTSMTTGNGLIEGSFRSLRILMRSCPGVSLEALHGEHRRGIERLAERGLTPAEIDASREGVCRAMDEFLTRRLGGAMMD